MMNPLNLLGYNSVIEYQQIIIDTISSYKEKLINIDGSVTYKEVRTTYFIDNDAWHIDFFGGIEQFKKQYEKYKYKNKNIFFRFNNPNINKEIKFIIYHRFFKTEWSFCNAFVNQNSMFKRLSDFINEKYPNLNSILDLDIDKANFEWIDWLENKGIKTLVTRYEKSLGKECTCKTTIAYLLNQVYQELFSLTDTRIEWEKDIWDIKNLEKYGLTFNKSSTSYLIDFTSIENENIKTEIKRYFKQKLLSNHKFTIGTARHVFNFIQKFIYCILQLEPTWNDLKKLDREHIEKYIEWLNTYTVNRLTRKDANVSSYKIRALTSIQKFLSDIQIKEYSIAPIKNARMLIFPDDKPTLNKKSYKQIKYIPDYVLDQLFNNINNLHKEVIPVIWVMYKTGLRISDVLGLKQDCLVKLNNKYWVETDIEKTYEIGHRIPIDDELANMLSILINNTKQNSNEDNNPENYIFVRYNGSRKGRPYSKDWIRNNLNAFAREYNIIDEMGHLYHFKNHSFRHTYAIKVLNGGADILTVQELLAHASPEMTMRYARLLDDNKRKVFDNVINQGIFSFDIEGKLYEETHGDTPEDILDMLWTNHKLSSIDTPYGTCLQRSKGKCNFAKQPPCLTCNGGRPCKDLAVGIFEGDVKKYEIHINATRSLIEQAKYYNREDMARENEELLNLYEEIYDTVYSGNIVYGKLDRLIKKVVINNE
ncbi:tyrosine-type recombinase/integrase [Tissierella carlieri]|jgi:integrase|uniref:tyrosine-type recombinase/integrase n=1 Tax=Tissierella carlieri TaxID=689904 RepID=UPI001C0FED51|nr:site-specific integrase [Tissierella carlieri]MBU5310406.1 tyrosine-type recombinase/integrase [Tissierella carlieri]MDU5083540.1 site-specific integrase [Bacillota bacterium]